MAPVNPPIQRTNDPSYGANSRPVDVPDVIRPRGVEENRILPEGVKQGDRSAEFEGQAQAYGMQAEGAKTSGFASLFEGITKVGDALGKMGVEVVKKDIENRVYDVANAERQSYTEALEKVKAAGGTKGILGGSEDTPEGESPEEVGSLGDTLSALKGARDAGKISNSYYQGRLLAEAKDLRARYPGFRQEIDSEFAKVTGVNPANAYINSLVTDINRQNAQAGKGLAQGVSIIKGNLGVVNNGVNAAQAMEKLQSGEWDVKKVIEWVAPSKQEELNQQQRKAKMEDKNIDRSEASRQATMGLDSAASTITNRFMDATMNRLGITDPDSAGTVNQRFTPQQLEQEGQRILNSIPAIRAELKRKADSEGYTGKIEGGSEIVNKKIDAVVEQIKTAGEMIYNKQTGVLFSMQRSLQGMKDEDTSRLLRNSKVGPELRMNSIMKDLVGEQNLGKVVLNMVAGNFPKDISEYQKSWRKELMTQSQYGPTGQPTTVKDLFEDMKGKNINIPAVSAQVMDDLSLIGKSKMPDGTPVSDGMKVNYALAAFSPNGRGWLSQINPDGVDAQGRRIQGQNAVFQKLTSPEITREIKRLGEQNPDLWKYYKEWTEDTLGKHLIGVEVKSLEAIGENKNIKVGWDSDNKRFTVGYQAQPGMRNSGGSIIADENADPYFVRARSAVNRINSNLSNYKAVAEADGGDVDLFMLRSLRSLGADLTNVRGLPAQMINEVTNTRNFEGRFGASKR